MAHYISLPDADFIIGVIILAFAITSLGMLLWTGIKSFEKRGALFILAGAFMLFGFFFEFISGIYPADSINFSLMSHGFVLLAGIMLSASFYLSKRAIERSKKEAKA